MWFLSLGVQAPKKPKPQASKMKVSFIKCGTLIKPNPKILCINFWVFPSKRHPVPTNTDSSSFFFIVFPFSSSSSSFRCFLLTWAHDWPWSCDFVGATCSSTCCPLFHRRNWQVRYFFSSITPVTYSTYTKTHTYNSQMKHSASAFMPASRVHMTSANWSTSVCFLPSMVKAPTVHCALFALALLSKQS